MKIVGIVGSNADFSYNRLLLQFIARNFKKLIDVEVVDIQDIPMFNQSNDQTVSAPIQNRDNKSLSPGRVISATSQYSHTIPSPRQSFPEWLSFNIHP